MNPKNLMRVTPVAVLMLAALTVPAGHAAQGVGTYAEVVCTATDATAEAVSTWLVTDPFTFFPVPYARADAGGSAVGGQTFRAQGPLAPNVYYEWAQYTGIFIQATQATATASNNAGSVAAACEFDPFGILDFPPELASLAAACRAVPGDPVRHIEGLVGVDAAGIAWVAGAGFAHPLTGTLTAGAVSLEAPRLAWTDAVFAADFGPNGCSVRLG